MNYTIQWSVPYISYGWTTLPRWLLNEEFLTMEDAAHALEDILFEHPWLVLVDGTVFRIANKIDP